MCVLVINIIVELTNIPPTFNIIFRFSFCKSLEIRRFSLGHTFLLCHTILVLFLSKTSKLNLIASFHPLFLSFSLFLPLPLSLSFSLFLSLSFSLSLSLLLSFYYFFLSLSPFSFLSFFPISFLFLSLSVFLSHSLSITLLIFTMEKGNPCIISQNNLSLSFLFLKKFPSFCT